MTDIELQELQSKIMNVSLEIQEELDDKMLYLEELEELFEEQKAKRQ